MSEGYYESWSTDRAGRWDIVEVADALGCCVRGGGNWSAASEIQYVEVGSPVIDTRAAEPGALFVALQGANTHGIHHWSEAHERGATVILVGSDAPSDVVQEVANTEDGPFLLVCEDDGVAALGRLGRAWRRRCRFTVVGVTGSSGKTSTKDMLSALIRPLARVVMSQANNNNEIGVPLTLLSATPDTDVVICEMGMRGTGQIEYLCEIAEPDIGIVTNAGSAHLELLGTHAAIVQAKAELIAGTWSGGTAIVPARQPELLESAVAIPQRVITFGDAPENSNQPQMGRIPGWNIAAGGSVSGQVLVQDVHRTRHGIAGEVTITPDGLHIPFRIPVHGLHQAHNFAAALAAARCIARHSEWVAQAVERADWSALTAGRGTRHQLSDGIVVIDDAYNANPESMRAALTELEATSGARRVAVLGFMAELGAHSPALHREIGELVAASAIDTLVVIATDGLAYEYVAAWDDIREESAVVFPSLDEAIEAAPRWVHPGDSILVKGSNSAGLSRLVGVLVERFGMDARKEISPA